MSFIDDLEKNITDKGAQASAIVREKAEVLRINNAIAAQRVREKEAYQKIGKIYYDRVKGYDVSTDRMDSAIDELEAVLSEIDNLNESLDSIKKFVKCPVCGFEVSKDASFCGGCGNKMR